MSDSATRNPRQRISSEPAMRRMREERSASTGKEMTTDRGPRWPRRGAGSPRSAVRVNGPSIVPGRLASPAPAWQAVGARPEVDGVPKPPASARRTGATPPRREPPRDHRSSARLRAGLTREGIRATPRRSPRHRRRQGGLPPLGEGRRPPAAHEEGEGADARGGASDRGRHITRGARPRVGRPRSPRVPTA
jgi:hypothetical protein